MVWSNKSTWHSFGYKQIKDNTLFESQDGKWNNNYIKGEAIPTARFQLSVIFVIVQKKKGLASYIERNLY